MLSRALTIVVACVLAVLCTPMHAAGPSNAILISASAPIKELYKKVHDPANRGKTVYLEPGTYVLQASESPDTGGALRLQPGMKLIGSAVRADVDGDNVPDEIGSSADPFAQKGTATIIDARALAPVLKKRSDCTDPPGLWRELPDPAIHLGQATSLARLAVLAGSNVGIGEPAELDDPDEGVSASITDVFVVSVGTTTPAVSFGNTGCHARSARSVLTFTRNAIRGGVNGLVLNNILTGDAGDAIAAGPEILAVLAFNRFSGSSGFGVFARAGALSTDGGQLVIESTGNVFSGNRANIVGYAGVGNATSPSIGNRLRLTSRFDTFGPTTGDPGISIYGSFNVNSQPSANTADVRITYASFVHTATNPVDISIVGGASGSDNHVVALIAQTTVTTTDGTTPVGTLTIQDNTGQGSMNTARLLGSPESFTATNPAFTAPAASFFGG